MYTPTYPCPVYDSCPHRAHDSCWMGDARGCLHISLLSSSSVAWMGRRILVRPPLAFQLLVATAVAPNRTISRPKLAALLFPHLATTQRSGQLRLAIKKLKMVFEESGCESVLHIGNGEIAVIPACSTDLDEMLSESPLTLESLQTVAGQVLPGSSSKFADGLRQRTKNWIEWNVEDIYSALASVEDLRALQSSLYELRSVYPHSVIIAAYLCAVLRNLNLIEEFSREIEEFESEWIDTFGVADKPDVSALTERVLAGSRLQVPTKAPQPAICLDTSARTQGAAS